MVEKENKYLLITSVKAVNEMETRLKDLNSRFKNILTAKIDKPDDELIYALIVKNFSDVPLNLRNKLMNKILRLAINALMLARLIINLNCFLPLESLMLKFDRNNGMTPSLNMP